MANHSCDVIVLGAGMAGVCAALHLQARGCDVVIIDRHGAAGEETSFGNAGLIEAASIFPHPFPTGLQALARYAWNRTPEAHYQLASLPAVAPWLWRYWRWSNPRDIAKTARALAPLVLAALAEHEKLMAEAGAGGLLVKRGWIKLYRTRTSFQKAVADAHRLDDWRVPFDVLDRPAIAALEPAIDAGQFAGGLHLTTPAAVTDPGALVKAYAALFTQRGGTLRAGDAASLARSGGKWRVDCADGPCEATQALVALGPWSDAVFRPLGYAIPLGVKRGYHAHYGLAPGADAPTRPLLDSDGGYVLAPMRRGLRVTTGAEFARRDAPASPVQVDRTRPFVKSMFPGLGPRLDATAWKGARPCLPDMLPVIGPAPGHTGLWFDFGHQHLGFTLGPVTGRLIAEMMTGEAPFTDASPYSAARF